MSLRAVLYSLEIFDMFEENDQCHNGKYGSAYRVSRKQCIYHSEDHRACNRYNADIVHGEAKQHLKAEKQYKYYGIECEDSSAQRSQT